MDVLTARENVATLFAAMCCPTTFSRSKTVAEGSSLKLATDTAWTIYRAKHRDIDEADRRRCLLERHLQDRKACIGDPEEPSGYGVAYL